MIFVTGSKSAADTCDRGEGHKGHPEFSHRIKFSFLNKLTGFTQGQLFNLISRVKYLINALPAL